jgi:hypothetical protein
VTVEALDTSLAPRSPWPNRSDHPDTRAGGSTRVFATRKRQKASPPKPGACIGETWFEAVAILGEHGRGKPILI